MKPSKAYIMLIDTPESVEMAKTAIESCERLGMEYEIVLGIQNKTTREAIDLFSSILPVNAQMDDKAACATVTHFMIWKMIADRKECAVILEHDAILLHKPDFDVPDNKIVALGFKMFQVDAYDHEKVGPTKRIVDLPAHAGAHAYAITYITAEILLKELLERIGVPQAIDNTYFLRDLADPEFSTRVPMALADPICALGWLRRSSIWDKPEERNVALLTSFVNGIDRSKLRTGKT